MGEDYIFTFEWDDGRKSLNDYAVKWCKENNRAYMRDPYGRLIVDVDRHQEFSTIIFDHVEEHIFCAKRGEICSVYPH